MATEYADQSQQRNQVNIHLRHLNSKFSAKLKELAGLRLSIEDAQELGQATTQDAEDLLAALKKVTFLKQKNEDLVDAFTVHYGHEVPDMAEQADKAFQKVLDTYISLKADSEKLIRRINSGQQSEKENPPVFNVNITRRLEASESFAGNAGFQSDEEDIVSDISTDMEVDSCDEENKRFSEEKDDKEAVGKSNCLRNSVGGVIFALLFYYGLFLIISNVAKHQQTKKDLTPNPTLGTDDSSCGGDNFMLRDSVCDEATNNARCLFDGGNCCLEFKDETLCKDCSCILPVEPLKIKSLFDQRQVKPLINNAKDYFDNVAIGKWTVKVEDVVSSPVCATLCLDHTPKADYLNAWLYDQQSLVCKCAWLEAASCPETYSHLDWTLPNGTNWRSELKLNTAFVQLKKVIPCKCAAVDFPVVNGVRTLTSRKEAEDGASTTMSSWHCQQKCLSDEECAWFSWKFKAEQDQVEPQPGEGECVRVKERLDDNQLLKPQTLYQKGSGWLSSSKECNDIFTYHFNAFFNGAAMCPRTENRSNAVILVNQGLPNSGLELFTANENETLVDAQCHLTLLPTSNVDTSGSIISSVHHDAKYNHWIPLVCGDSTSSILDSKACRSLLPSIQAPTETSYVTTMLGARLGAAALSIDNGTRLWITGGSDLNDNHTQAFISSQIFSGITLSWNWGPQLPAAGRKHHCLVRIDHHTAIMMGGQDSDGYFMGSTWIVDIAKMTWSFGGMLDKPRSHHACGVLRDLAKPSSWIVIAAGGQISADGTATKTVEVLVVNEDVTHDATWEQGAQMIIKVWKAASAISADKAKMFVIGGFEQDDNGGSQASNLIHEMECRDRICSWNTRGQEHSLAMSMASPLAMVLPPSPAGYMNQYSEDCQDLKYGAPPGKLALIWSAGWTGIETAMDADIVFVHENSTMTYRCFHDQWHLHVRSESSNGGLLVMKKTYDTETPNLLEYATIFCGGRDGTDDNDIPKRDCYMNGRLVANLATGRYGAASLIIGNGKTLWVTGGHNGYTPLYSTEVIDFSRLTLVDFAYNNVTADSLPGVDLPAPLMYHCLVKADPSVVLLIGGSLYESPTEQSWTYAAPDPICPNQFQWTPIQSMTVARQRHACGALIVSEDPTLKVVVAAGGRTGDGDEQAITDTVELLVIQNNGTMLESVNHASWLSGPHMMEPLEGAAMVTDDRQGKLYLAGGATYLRASVSASSNAVYSFACKPFHCQWTQLETGLSLGRSYLLGALIPDMSPSEAEAVNLRVTDPNAYLCDCFEDLKNRATATGSSNLTLFGDWFSSDNRAITSEGLIPDGDYKLRGFFLLELYEWIQFDFITPMTIQKLAIVLTYHWCRQCLNFIAVYIGNEPADSGSGQTLSINRNQKCAHYKLESKDREAVELACNVPVSGHYLIIQIVDHLNMEKPLLVHDVSICGYDQDSWPQYHQEMTVVPVIEPKGHREEWIGFEQHGIQVWFSDHSGQQNNGMGYIEAAAYCNNHDNSALFEPANQAVFEEIVDAARRAGLATAWIGITDVYEEGVYRYWTDGDLVSFTDWANQIKKDLVVIKSHDVHEDYVGVLIALGQLEVAEKEIPKAAICAREFINHDSTSVVPVVTCYYLANGFCNEENNNLACNYDSGDCCLVGTICDYCSGDGCQCHETGELTCGANCPQALDGFCNGEQNTAECAYDGGDCCVDNANCTYCNSDGCICHETGLSHCPVDLSQCPESSLSQELVADGQCDGFLNNAECSFDGGDCCIEQGKCEIDCWTECKCHLTGKRICMTTTVDCAPANGVCNGDSNIEECGFDHGECCLEESNCAFCYNDGCVCHETGQSHCPFEDVMNRCDKDDEYISDHSDNGICNEELNTEECEYDGGDCCLEEANCDNCKGAGCLCHETGLAYCSYIGAGCPGDVHSFVKDDYCQGEANIEECSYDGGDCCKVQSFCPYDCIDSCICNTTGVSHCLHTCYYLGNGFCNSENNNWYCHFDDGDCCLAETYCPFCNGAECHCPVTGQSNCIDLEGCNGELTAYIYNDYCSSELNSEPCDYDGGDCCLDHANCDYCDGDGCLCHETGLPHCQDDGQTDGVVDLTNCPESLNQDYFFDGYCDDDLNNLECGYDGGDCCLAESNFDYCDICDCLF